MSNGALRLGIAGLGTVAQGVLSLLKENRSRIESHLGRNFIVEKVASRTYKPDIDLIGADFNTDLESLVQDDVDVVVELIGGTTDAFHLVDLSLDRGKHVVTANKALLAAKGNELFSKARRNALSIGFEASVAGGIPVIDVVKNGLSGNRITSVVGIVNGTSNFILSAMGEDGKPFERALKEAQELGFAEMDPSFDVEGIDAAQKLSLLSALAFDQQIDGEAVYVEGISAIDVADLHYANELGFCIKHVAIARLNGDRIENRVHPALIPSKNLLSQVTGVQNAVLIDGNGVESLMLVGPGAGAKPTASSVLADVIAIGNGVSTLPATASSTGGYTSMNEIECANYINIEALDVPGVIATIGEVLAKNNVSIEAVIQKPDEIRVEDGDARVPVVILTNRVRESAMNATLTKIARLPTVSDTIRRIRVLDLE